MKAQALLEKINAVRHLRGLPAINELQLPSGHGNPLDAAEQATGLSIDGDRRKHKYFFECETASLARKIGDALGQPFDENTFTVPLPPEIEDFVIASAFDLVFIAPDGTLRGWIDPADRDPSLWELHLMPGIAYPAGHEPLTPPGQPG